MSATAPPPQNWSPIPASPQASPQWNYPPQSIPAPQPPPRPMSMGMISFVIWAVAILCTFLGVVLIVAFASVPSSCFGSTGAFAPSGCTSFPGQMVTAIMIGKVLVTLGLTGFIVGAAWRMHYTLHPSSNARPEEWAYLSGDRRWMILMICVCLVMLVVLLTTVNTMPPMIPGVGH